MQTTDAHAAFIAKEYVRRLGDLSLFRVQDQLVKAAARAAWFEVQRWQEVQGRAIRLIERFHRREYHRRKGASFER